MTDEPGLLYRLISETIPHMVWAARADGELDFFNRRCHEYTGLESRALEGWGWKAVVHPEDWERCLSSWTRALQTGERYEIEYRLRRFDGEYRWHHGTAVPMRDAGGRLQRWFGTCTDIEAEVRSAQILEGMVEQRSRDLRETERRFQLFMEHMPAAAWIKDAQLRYTFVNRAHEELHGRRAGQVIGRDDFELWPAEVARQLRRHDETALAGGAALQTLERVPYADGRPGDWLVVKFALGDAAGGTGVAGIGFDITARVNAEEQARAYAADARRLLDQLIAAQESERRRLADELHDLIGQNLTALGIDLAALKERLGALPGGLPAALPERIDAMRSVVEDTIGAIRGVMTDLRPPALEEYGLVPALRWYAAEFGERTGMKATLSVSCPERRLPKDAEFSLFRIAQEALTNAAKHSGGSSVRIGVAEEGGRLQLSIEDDGRGFADPAGSSGARRGGWGLPAMRERAEAHGGVLRIESPGKGTRVVVEVPVHAD